MKGRVPLKSERRYDETKIVIFVKRSIAKYTHFNQFTVSPYCMNILVAIGNISIARTRDIAVITLGIFDSEVIYKCIRKLLESFLYIENKSQIGRIQLIHA